MNFDFFALFLIGFLGGFSHCLGMCGGFVVTYTIKINASDSFENPSFWQKLVPHLLYNSGRLLTYSILGEIFGLLGSTLGIVFAIKNFQGGLQLLAGSVMLLMGLDLAGLIPNLKPDTFPGIHLFKGLVQSFFQGVNRRNIFILGLILGLIPCGLVYAVGAKAAATQSIIGGFFTMFIFGLGTFPAMILAGLTTQVFSANLRSRLYRIAAVLVALVGLLTIFKGIDALGWYSFFWLQYL